MKRYVLVDCNNFYVACERLFDPALAGRPVVVLSNNDGCIVARCQRAKALGIAMGTPVFKIRPLLQRHNVAVRSSNYELYGDISGRVMRVLARFSPDMEVYSIDEAFLGFDERAFTIRPALGEHIRATLLRWIGIPVGVGIGPTKTLAKAANWKAKQCPSGAWSVESDLERRELLAAMPVAKVWGIGSRFTRRLNARGIFTAGDFVERLDARQVQREFTVAGLRTWRELRGFPCLKLEDAPPARQSICTSRSFAAGQTERPGIEAAVADFAARCAAKLRRSDLAASLMQVFMFTDRFRDDQPQHCPAGMHIFTTPSQDTLEIAAAAANLVRRIFRQGCIYKKAGVIVSGLLPAGAIQTGLFDADAHRAQRQALMSGMDKLNRRFGRAAVATGGTMASPSGTWKTRHDFRTPRYTTRWDEIVQVR